MNEEKLIELIKAQSELLVSLSERVSKMERSPTPEKKKEAEKPTEEELNDIFGRIQH